MSALWRLTGAGTPAPLLHGSVHQPTDRQPARSLPFPQAMLGPQATAEPIRLSSAPVTRWQGKHDRQRVRRLAARPHASRSVCLPAAPVAQVTVWPYAIDATAMRRWMRIGGRGRGAYRNGRRPSRPAAARAARVAQPRVLSAPQSAARPHRCPYRPAAPAVRRLGRTMPPETLDMSPRYPPPASMPAPKVTAGPAGG